MCIGAVWLDGMCIGAVTQRDTSLLRSSVSYPPRGFTASHARKTPFCLGTRNLETGLLPFKATYEV